MKPESRARTATLTAILTNTATAMITAMTTATITTITTMIITTTMTTIIRMANMAMCISVQVRREPRFPA